MCVYNYILSYFQHMELTDDKNKIIMQEVYQQMGLCESIRKMWSK